LSVLVTFSLVEVNVALLLIDFVVNLHFVRSGSQILILAEFTLKVAEDGLREDLDVGNFNSLEPDAPAIGERLQRVHDQGSDGVAVFDDIVDRGVGNVVPHN